MEQGKFTKGNIQKLELLINNNPQINFRTIDLTKKESLSLLSFAGFEWEHNEVRSCLLAYQRLLRVIPNDKRKIIFALLINGIHSAIQIASMPKREFVKKYHEIVTDNSDLSESIYISARNKRNRILIQYMKNYQNKEPHISSAWFNNPRKNTKH